MAVLHNRPTVVEDRATVAMPPGKGGQQLPDGQSRQRRQSEGCRVKSKVNEIAVNSREASRIMALAELGTRRTREWTEGTPGISNPDNCPQRDGLKSPLRESGRADVSIVGTGPLRELRIPVTPSRIEGRDIERPIEGAIDVDRPD